MAVQKIDYENKIGLQNDENVPNKNKVTDEDMNQIKSKVNNNADELSTAQQNIEDLQEGQGTASSDITNLKNRVTTLEGDNTKNKQDIANKVDKVEGKGLSTEDYTTAEKQKLAGLNNYDDTEIKQDIQELQTDVSDIKAEQEVQNNLLQRTQSALINITTPKSSNINVKDSSDLNAKIDVYGISSQKTRSGINLTNYKEWVGLSTKEQITKKDDDEIICTITDSSYGVRDIGRILKPNTNYTACVDSKFSGNLGSQYGLRVNVNGSITSLKADGLVNFTTDETGKAEMRYYVGFPYSGENATLTVSNIRLYEGTYTKENIPDYEQYGASPTPEFPSEIENVTGNIDITVCNKNLANLEIVSNQFNVTTEKINANTFKITRTANTSSSYGQVEMNLDANKTYTVFVKISGENTTGACITLWKGYNGNGTYSESFTNYKTIQTTQDLLIIGLYPNQSNNLSGLETTFEIMIIEGNNINEDFVPHEEQLITFPLQENQKLYNGDYLASDGIHHVRKQIELDGTENWQLTARDGYYAFWLAYNEIGMIDRYNKKICTHFLYYAQLFTEAPINSICENSGSPNMIIFKVDFCTTIGEWKTYLSQQKAAGTPVIVEYELAEEEIEPYTPEQQEAYNKLQNVLSYYNVTNVFTDKALLVFKYIADTQTWTVNLVKSEIANTNQQILEIAGGN